MVKNILTFLHKKTIFLYFINSKAIQGITIRRFIGEKVVRATVLYVMLGVIFAVEVIKNEFKFEERQKRNVSRFSS